MPPNLQAVRNRLVFKFTGRWPQSVVDRRLAELPRLTSETRRRLDAMRKESEDSDASARK